MLTIVFHILEVIKREVWERKKLFLFLYVATSCLFLAAAWLAPRIYTSYSTILVDEKTILRPLMEGTAVTQTAVDRAKVAEELIFSRSSMQMILEKAGWMEGNPSALEQEGIIEDIYTKTDIYTTGQNIFRIMYRDSDPQRAYLTTKLFTESFIDQSLRAKEKESRDAYDFISKQVNEYHANLKKAELAAKEFRANNIDARPGMQAEVNERITHLRRIVTQTRTNIQEALIQKQALESQLSGEASVGAQLSRDEQYLERIATLQQQLDTLKLSYQDAYPDIVRIKGQIEEVKTAMLRDQQMRENMGEYGRTQLLKATNNPLFLELRSKVSNVKTEIATYHARLRDTMAELKAAEERILRINDVETRLAELNRDYEVNQEIYQVLLKQRERARISMNIDQENRGITIRVQEPPSVPLSPRGIRFSHFLIAGFIMSFLIPIGVIYGLTLFDGKIRDEKKMSDSLGLSPLACVGLIYSPSEVKRNYLVAAAMCAVITACWLSYVYAAYLRIQ